MADFSPETMYVHNVMHKIPKLNFSELEHACMHGRFIMTLLVSDLATDMEEDLN